MDEIIRSAQSGDAAGIARVHVASWISTYQFYARPGGQVMQHRQEDDHGEILEEVAYGWQDMRLLL